MKNRKTFYLAVLITLLALGVFSTVLVHAFWYDPSDEIPFPEVQVQTSNTASVNTETKVAPPTTKQDLLTPPSSSLKSLIVPALNIDAKIQEVGITKNGNMATPSNFTDVGWYKYGVMPGELGSAVMAGHVDNGVALPGVFKHLGDLKAGDDIYVEVEGGKKIHYVVSNIATYDYDADAEKVFSENDKHYLKLITCAGVWVPSYKTHNKRLVVTAIEAS